MESLGMPLPPLPAGLPLLAASLPLLALAALYLWRSGAASGAPSVPTAEYLPGGKMHTLIFSPARSHHMLCALHAQLGPAFYARLGPNLTLFTAYPADVLPLLRKLEDFTRPPAVQSTLSNLGKGGVFLLPDDLHRRVRKDIRSVFSPALLEGFWVSLNTASRKMAQHLDRPSVGAGEDASALIDVLALFQAMTVRLIFNVAFGANFSEDEVAVYGKHSTKHLQFTLQDLLRQPVKWFLGR